MEPIAALALVTNIISVTKLASEVVQYCREQAQSTSGLLRDQAQLYECCEKLQALVTAIDADDEAASTTSTFSRSVNRGVQYVAAQCSDTAKSLLGELDSVRKKPSQPVIINVLRVMWKKGKIRELEQRLARIRGELDAHLICEIHQELKLSKDANRAAVEKLAEEQKEILLAIQNGCETVTAVIAASREALEDAILRAAVKTQLLVTKTYDNVEQNINQQFDIYKAMIGKQQIEANQKAEREEDAQFLQSLAFEEMNWREEAIDSQCDASSYESIFTSEQEPECNDSSWESFTDWLKSGEGLYWITGKAGAGKSTLVSFICEHRRTSELLQQWAGTNQLVISRHFFWGSGTQLQSNSTGLLRSFLYQILDNDADLLTVTRKSFSTGGQRGLQWTLNKLRSTIFQILQLQRFSICLFIDGLDEIGGGPSQHVEMMAFVNAIVQSSKNFVKCCLASRPELIFATTLRTVPSLKLHDLNWQYIESYALSRLPDFPKLASDIAFSAQGMFQWATCAVNTIIRGSTLGEDYESLNHRLSLLPPEIDLLYAHMLSGMDDSSQKEAALLFSLIVAAAKEGLCDLRHLQLASSPKAKAWFQDSIISEKAAEPVVEQIEFFKKRLVGISAGLLEDCENRISFIHRSVSDFLTRTTSGKDFLKKSELRPEEVCVAHILGHEMQILEDKWRRGLVDSCEVVHFYLRRIEDPDLLHRIINYILPRFLSHTLLGRGFVCQTLSFEFQWTKPTNHTEYQSQLAIYHDNLRFASCLGLNDYVQKMIGDATRQGSPPTSQYLTNLLACAAAPGLSPSILERRFFPAPHNRKLMERQLVLLRYLLQQGAESSDAWLIFLKANLDRPLYAVERSILATNVAQDVYKLCGKASENPCQQIYCEISNVMCESENYDEDHCTIQTCENWVLSQISMNYAQKIPIPSCVCANPGFRVTTAIWKSHRTERDITQTIERSDCPTLERYIPYVLSERRLDYHQYDLDVGIRRICDLWKVKYGGKCEDDENIINTLTRRWQSLSSA